MGKRGPLPDPNSQRTSMGINTFRGTSVEPVSEKPFELPQSLSSPENAAAAEFWNRYEELLRTDGLLTKRTILSFTEMSLIFQQREMLRIQKALSLVGIAMLKELSRRFDNYLKEFGLTPNSRQKLPSPPKPKDASWENRFNYAQNNPDSVKDYFTRHRKKPVSQESKKNQESNNSD